MDDRETKSASNGKCEAGGHGKGLRRHAWIHRIDHGQISTRDCIIDFWSLSLVLVYLAFLITIIMSIHSINM